MIMVDTIAKLRVYSFELVVDLSQWNSFTKNTCTRIDIPNQIAPIEVLRS